MTRDAEHTPSPQSVVVPREPTEAMLSAAFEAFEIDQPKQYADGTAARKAIWSAMLASASGEITNEQIQSVMLAAIKEVRASVTDAAEGACMDADIIRMERGLVDMGDTGWAVMRSVHRRLAALSPEAPARERVAKALYLKLIDTLKPFAEVAEKLKHCHVVEICEPTPDNPSRNIIPMPREWFERAADDLEVIAIQLHSDGVLSEGQTAKLTGLDRVEVRKQADALTPRHEAPAEDGPVFHMNLLSHEDNEAWLESARRVAAKHEAPAEGAGEWQDISTAPKDGEPIEVRQNLNDGTYRSCRTSFGTYENSHGGTSVGWTCKPDDMRAEEWRPVRARSSAPEALGNLLAVIHGDGGHRALEVGVEQAAAEAEKIVAGLFAAPSADKLRIAIPACRGVGVARLGRATEHDAVWAAMIDIDTTGDGEADDREIRLFATREEAIAATPDALKGDAK